MYFCLGEMLPYQKGSDASELSLSSGCRLLKDLAIFMVYVIHGLSLVCETGRVSRVGKELVNPRVELADKSAEVLRMKHLIGMLYLDEFSNLNRILGILQVAVGTRSWRVPRYLRLSYVLARLFSYKYTAHPSRGILLSQSTNEEQLYVNVPNRSCRQSQLDRGQRSETEN